MELIKSGIQVTLLFETLTELHFKVSNSKHVCNLLKRVHSFHPVHFCGSPAISIKQALHLHTSEDKIVSAFDIKFFCYVKTFTAWNFGQSADHN